MIAISYRREDSLPIAGRLYDRLQAKFGKKNVFMDFDSIPPGADFRQHIKQMIERSRLVIAIIGPHWLGEQPDASRRIDNPADFVRLEIAYALEGGIPVIPLLINTTQMPKPEMLPPDIQELAFRHALPLDSGMDFHSHADRLITGIHKAMAVAPRSGRRQQVAEPTASPVDTRPLRRIVVWSAAILLAGAVLAFAVRYISTHEPQSAKQVATAKSDRGSVEPAITPPLFVKPPVEQSSPPQLAVEQPKPVVEQSSKSQITRPAFDFASITKEHPYVNSLGMKFVPVPITGGPTSGQLVLFSIWDTRVRDFAAFVEQGGYDMSKGEAAYTIESDGKGGWTWKQAGGNWKDPHFPPEASQTEEHPVVCVSWNDAVAFCQWLTDKEHRSGQLPQDWSYRLPSDHEWSCAVGIGEKEDASKMPEAKDAKIKGVYPWGKQWPPPRGAGNYAGEESRIGMARKGSSIIAGYDDGAPRTSAVGQYTANEYGLYDMGGNVWQWCQDKYKSGESWRVLRGASWLSGDPGNLLSSCRNDVTPTLRRDCYGFRVVVARSASENAALSESEQSDEAPPGAHSTRSELSATGPAQSPAPGSPVAQQMTPGHPSATPQLGNQQLLRVYVKKYGVSVLLPTELFPDAAAKLADANTDRLVSVNGCFRVAFNALSGPVKKAYDNCIAEVRKKADQPTIDYKVLKDTWFVVSGDSDTHYYTKGVKRGDNVIVMALEYEGDACNDIADATLTEISRKFDGN